MYPYNIEPQISAANTPNSESNEGNNKDIPVTDKYLLEMIEDAAADEIEAAEHYARLAEAAPNEADKNMLRGMHFDELKHYKMLLNMYKALTGHDMMEDKPELEASENFLYNIQECFFEELEDVEFYRTLLLAFLNLEIRDWLYEIITDEQNHAQKLNFLYSKYK